MGRIVKERNLGVALPRNEAVAWAAAQPEPLVQLIETSFRSVVLVPLEGAALPSAGKPAEPPLAYGRTPGRAALCAAESRPFPGELIARRFRTIPVTVFGDTVVKGFDADALTAAIAAWRARA